MPQRKKMETPRNKPKISSMTYEKEEETQHDISKLWDQVQQNSLSQNVIEVKMDSLKKGVKAKMDGMGAKMNGMDAKMDGMDDKMEELKINLNKLLQEMVTNGERIVKETHDENKKMLIMIP